MNPRSEPFGTLGFEVKRDVHKKNLDAKIIITSHNSRPGLSKTTLAIKMCKDLDANSWNAEDKAFMDAHEYHNAYDDCDPGSCLLFDEIEGEADSRRAMSNKNVELSQAWAQNRYRNMITICTLPSVSMLDNRMLEMADYWINVMDRGEAHPYRIRVNDFNGKVYRVRMDDDAVIRYKALPEDDPDKAHLDEEKHSRRTSIGKQYYDEDEHQEAIEKAVEEAEREYRNDVIQELYRYTELSNTDIADFEWCDVKPVTVKNLLSEVDKEVEPSKSYRDILIRELYERTDLSQPDISRMDWCDVSQSQVGYILNK